jgi:hypothetical protein
MVIDVWLLREEYLREVIDKRVCEWGEWRQNVIVEKPHIPNPKPLIVGPLYRMSLVYSLPTLQTLVFLYNGK